MQFLETGFHIVDDFISTAWRQAILEEMAQSIEMSRGGGIRNIDKKLKTVEAYLHSVEFQQKSEAFLPPNAALVRAILFNKSAESNWYVSWHQDKTVSVSARFEDPEWRAWSVKEEIIHVQPPFTVLENMVTIRVHLDAASKDNACLQVITGSHQLGVLNAEQIHEIVAQSTPHFCETKRDAALIMRPHLLHASSKSKLPDSRRVLHFEFSTWRLPDGIHWN
ncbi:phytanoyl-CoA dioxygenase family protein [Undibacterium sp. Ji22W]|uniref:phytanoyl-CoA dioxygenase family protein n=1 Tax=Undibacterium sp. Ji22W TaxID=3413038 RepID=UPI003BF05086